MTTECDSNALHVGQGWGSAAKPDKHVVRELSREVFPPAEQVIPLPGSAEADEVALVDQTRVHSFLPAQSVWTDVDVAAVVQVEHVHRTAEISHRTAPFELVFFSPAGRVGAADEVLPQNWPTWPGAVPQTMQQLHGAFRGLVEGVEEAEPRSLLVAVGEKTNGQGRGVEHSGGTVR